VADLTVSDQWQDGRALLSLAGELDMAAVPVLRQVAADQLGADGCRGLTLDFSGITFLDSSGIGVLVEVHNMARLKNVDVRLVNVPSGQARIITIAGLAETFGLGGEESTEAH
jgi:anti-anti-sigma factor